MGSSTVSSMTVHELLDAGLDCDLSFNHVILDLNSLHSYFYFSVSHLAHEATWGLGICKDW